MESILNGYEDPVVKSILPLARMNSLQASIAAFVRVHAFAHNYYNTLSKLKVTQQTDAVLMPAAEVWFLRAEAALRDGPMSRRKPAMKKGVMASFRQYGILQSDAYLESDLLPADFVDTYDMENDITARCQVSPRWLESADRDTETGEDYYPKWIAMFPEGCEA